MGRFGPKRLLALCLVTLAVVASGKLRELKPASSVAKIPIEQDIKIGQQALNEVPKQAPVITNATIQQTLDRIVKRLAAQPEAGRFPYTVRIIQDASINASAYPGGAMFVHTGLLSAADNEDQVAGVMAHEVSHVALRHGVANMVRGQRMQAAAGIGSVLAGVFLGNGIGGQLAQMGIGLGANSLMLKNSREAETEADLLGTRIMNGAGYNPIEMARFFEKLEADGGSRGPQFFASHPNPGNRIKSVENEIQLLPQARYNAAQPREFSQAKAAVQSLKAAPKPTSAPRGSTGGGTVGEGAGGMRRYDGGVFAMDFPPQWQVFGDGQNPDGVILAPRNAVDRQGNVFAGALVSAAPLNGGLERSTHAVIENLARQNRGMRTMGERPIQVDGRQGRLTTLSTQTAAGEPETDYLLTVAAPDRLFYVVFITPDRNRPQAEPVFQKMIESLKFKQ